MGRRCEGGVAARSLIAAAALAGGLIGVGETGVAAPKASIRLTILDLVPGAAYAGTCRLTAADGPDEVAIEGAKERTYEFTAASLRCEIDATSGLTVALEKDGSRSRASTSGGRIVVSIS